MVLVETSIVILCKNEEKNIALCLSGIYVQQYKDFEVIVIDSGSTDRTLEIAKDYPVRLYHIKPEEFKHAHTRNYGASLCEGDYIVFITADAYPQDEMWLGNLLGNFDDPTVAGVYGRQIAKSAAYPMEQCFLDFYYTQEKRVQRLEGPQTKVKDVFFSNVTSAIRKTLLIENPFPEDVVMAEDFAWALSVLKKGHAIVYEPKAVVHHSHNYTFSQAFKRFFDVGAAHRNIFQQNGFRAENSATGAEYLKKEFVFLLREKKLHLLPWAWLYNGTKFIGFFLGSHYRLFPHFLIRRLSLNPKFWGQNQS